MTKMVITDLDNTLIRRDGGISDYTVDVLKKCQSAGLKVVFATARSKRAASRYLNRFPPDIFVGYGGALVLAGEKIIQQIDISPDIANQIIKECLETPEVIYVHAINESVALSNDLRCKKNPEMTRYKYTDFTCEYDYRYLKISLKASNPVAVENIASHFPMCDMLRYTGEDLYRFANRDAVKWNAVKVIAKHYDCDTVSFVAFGDDYNDLEMIQKCGTGVAVKNAVSEVKSAAKYICETNDNDGVAKWIEEYLL